jgi:hypothetical protein
MRGAAGLASRMQGDADGERHLAQALVDEVEVKRLRRGS